MTTYTAQDWARDLEQAIADAGLNVGAPYGRATSRAVGRVIGITSRTIDRWRAAENCPGEMHRTTYLDRLRAISLPTTAAVEAHLPRDAAATRFTTPEERLAFAAGILTVANIHADQLKACIAEALAVLITPGRAVNGEPSEPMNTTIRRRSES